MLKKKKGDDVWGHDHTYRKQFLSHNKGIFGRWYICAYCGKIISVEKMDVDHICAVNYVKHNLLIKLFFGTVNTISNIFGPIFKGKKYKKKKGINVTYNLIPSCRKCNRGEKSDKGGIWIIRGIIGGTIWKLINMICNVFRIIFSKPGIVILGIAAVAGLLIYAPQVTGFIEGIEAALKAFL